MPSDRKSKRRTVRVKLPRGGYRYMTPEAAKKHASQRQDVEKRRNIRISKRAMEESKKMSDRCKKIQKSRVHAKSRAKRLGQKIEILQAKKESLDIFAQKADQSEMQCWRASDELYKKHMKHKRIAESK